MKLTKTQREQVRSMFDGRCAYCGCELGQKWHADHFIAVKRTVGFMGHGTQTGAPSLETDIGKCPECGGQGCHKDAGGPVGMNGECLVCTAEQGVACR